MTLGEFGVIFSGLTGKSKADFADGNVRYVPYTDVFSRPVLAGLPNAWVRVGEHERQRQIALGDILFTASSEVAGDVGMSSVVVAEPSEPVFLNSFCFGFRPGSGVLAPDYARHVFRTGQVRRQIVRTANGVTRFNVSKARFLKIAIPVPSLEEQRRIARILDRFDALVNDLTRMLPAEIAARRQQYEHYRDRLLTFPDRAAAVA